MSIYYADELVTIHHARCEDVLPTIDPADVNLVLTDPPYGIDLNVDYSTTRNTNRRYDRAIDGDDEPFDPAALLAYGRCVLWGANNYASRLPDAPAWIVWDKACQAMTTGFRNSEAELAWTNVTRRMQVMRHQWIGSARATERGMFLHPTQKPVALMRWVVQRWTEPGDLVLDPYMGSGPVAQACHELGRRYIGIEMVEDYCRVAVGRLAQQTLNLDGDAA